MGIREDTAALNALTVQHVGKLLGLKLPLKGMARCPLPGHVDSTPSFEVRSSGLRWVCYGCNEWGGAIDLVMSTRVASFVEAKRWLADASGMTGSSARTGLVHASRAQMKSTNASTQVSDVRSSSLAPIAKPNEVDEAAADGELYAALFAGATLEQEGRRYLKDRGFSCATIKRFKIGELPGLELINDLVVQFGFDRVQASGLLTKNSKPERYWPIFPKGALLFPYLEGGQIAYLQARLIADNVKGSRWRNLSGRRRRIYNVNTLTNPSIRRIGICEGAMDVLSATQLGCEAIGLIGVSARLSDIEIISLRRKQVDLFLDWDEAGEKRAVTLRKELARFGVAATRKTAPRSGAKDVNDYLREGNTSL